jgi:peroxiredoxin
MNTVRACKWACAVCAVFSTWTLGAGVPVSLAQVSSSAGSSGGAGPSSGAATKSDGSKAEPAPLTKLKVRVLDPDGNPVAGAHVGLAAHFGVSDDAKKPADTDADGFVYEGHRLTDSQGIAQLEAAGADLRPILDDQGIVVRQEKRHLAGVVHVDPARLKETVDIMLVPECFIGGKVISPELKKAEKPLGSTTVSLGDGDHVMATCTSDATGEYHFFVPPGEYLLDAGGSHIVRVFAAIVVPPKEHDLVFEPMVAAASKLALLEGQPAPELRGVAAWKNGPPVTLASLKGKCVLLFFWRATSPASLEAVPAIVEVYDKLKKAGLAVVGVEVDVDRDKKPIDSAQKLDETLAKVKTEAWGGRDLPFPVAIVPPNPTPLGEKFTAPQFADSPVSADYGVTQYPTVLLIDRHGVLVDELVDSDQSLALLGKTLGLQPTPAPGSPAKAAKTAPAPSADGKTPPAAQPPAAAATPASPAGPVPSSAP